MFCHFYVENSSTSLSLSQNTELFDSPGNETDRSGCFQGEHCRWIRMLLVFLNWLHILQLCWNLRISSWAPSLCTGKRSCDLQTGSLTFSFSVYIRFTSFSCLVSLAKMPRMILIVILIILVRTGILFWFQDLEARLSACPHPLWF